jgi:putative spermidine/putrescine transport system ATP-binding protein
VELEDGGQVLVEAENVMGSDRTCTVGDAVKLYIRPEKLTIQPSENLTPDYNSHTATIVQMNYLGSAWEIEVSLLGERMQVWYPSIEAGWTIGTEVMVGWNPSDMMIVKK